MEIIEVLTNIGLTKNEAKVYLKLLKVENSMAGALAHKTNLHRSNVYDALDLLIRKGLASFTVIDQKKHFKAKPAEALLSFVESKQSEVKQILPEIQRINSLKEKKENIYLSKGLFAIKEAMTSLLDSGNEVLIYGIPESNYEQIIPFIENFNKQRAEFKVGARYIYTSKDEEWIKKIAKFKNTEVRYLSSDESKISRIVSGDKAILIIWNNPSLVMIVEHKDVADFYKHEFEILWKHAKKL